MASNDTVDPFMAPSQLFLWSAAEEKVKWLIIGLLGNIILRKIFIILTFSVQPYPRSYGTTCNFRNLFEFKKYFEWEILRSYTIYGS